MIGTTVSHYRILEKLGEGGMGVVYKARDNKLDRLVALKFLPAHVSVNEETKARFNQEAKAAAALNHAHICTIHGVEEHDGSMFIVMEYIEGGTLRQKLPYAKVDDALIIALQIGEALQEAHAKGIVHRDIKSDNVMLTSKGQAKVMDFGLAKLKGSLKLTRTSSTVGTLAYMAPEQVHGGEVDSRSDIFSFGVLLFEMLSGRLPFRGEHEAAMMYSILNEDPDPINKYLPQASPELIHILNRALEKDPVDRYQQVSDMDIDLRRLKKETSKVSRKSMHVVEPSAPTEPESSASTVQKEFVPQDKAPRTTTVTFKIPTMASRKMLVWLGPLVLVAAGLIGYFMFFNAKEEAGERVPVAVADFINQTKEEQLDGLSGMLITSLEQSRRLSVLTRSRMFDILRVMGKGNVDRIDESLGREISRQANVKALVVASISKFDELYIIDMKVLDPEKNEYILTVKEQAEGKSSIPGIIDKLAEQTRLGLKERKADVDANTQKVAELTTPNMEAYQEYFSGEELVNKLRFEEAAEHFRKATIIDSSFGLAWYRLAYALAWNSSPGQEAAIARALRLQDRVPEKERYLIRVQDALVREEANPAITLLKELLILYPDDKETNYLLGDYTFHQGDFETAKTTLRKVLSMDPLNERAHQHLYWTLSRSRLVEELKRTAEQYVKHVPSYTSYSLLADAYTQHSQYDSALQICRVGIEKFPGNAFLKRQLGDIHVLAQSPEAARGQYNRLIDRDRTFDERLEGYYGLVDLTTSRGEYRKAVAIVDAMLKLEPPTLGRRHTGTSLMLRAGMKVVYLRDITGGRSDYERALQFEDAGAQTYAIFRYLYHLHSGEYQKARNVVNARLRVISSNFIVTIDGSEAMKSGNYGTALEHFTKIAHPTPFIQYQTARVYTSTGQYSAAISSLSDLRTNYSVFESGGNYSEFVDMYPLSYYLEGTIYERTNERAKAIKSYETFLRLWRNADKDIPQYVDAKDRLAALR